MPHATMSGSAHDALPQQYGGAAHAHHTLASAEHYYKAAPYAHERGGAWLQRYALLLLAAVAGWWALSVGYSEVLVFRDLLSEKQQNYEEAFNYYHAPKSMCKDENADFRVLVGARYDQCWSAKRVVDGSPWTEACIDLLKRWRICTNGSCTVFSFDFFNALPFIFNATLFACMLIGAFVVYKVLSMIYSNFQRNSELPLCATPTQLAAMAFAHQHGAGGACVGGGNAAHHKKQF